MHDLRVFGLLCFIYSTEINSSKLVPRAKKCVFLEYKNDTKGYIVLDIESREILVSRNIRFYEHVFSHIKNHNSVGESFTESNFNFCLTLFLIKLMLIIKIVITMILIKFFKVLDAQV